MRQEKHVSIFGAGPAGIVASAALSELGYEVSLIESKDVIGGHLQQWDHLFPEKRLASDILANLSSTIKPEVTVYLSDSAKKIEKNKEFSIQLTSGKSLKADAILLATGFDTFDASRKEEYGYGIYDHVITSADLELRFKEYAPMLSSAGVSPKKIGFVHCVGSRDEKAGHMHCSKAVSYTHLTLPTILRV